MRSIAIVSIVMFIVSIGMGEEAPTWIEIENTVYGAKPDERGPIGGGAGYASILTKGDFTVADLDGLLDALRVARSGQIVFIPGETEIDLTSLIYIEQLVLEVPEGVIVAGDRGSEGSKGAMLVSDALNTPMMIRAKGPNVRITGLRMRGPNSKRFLDHHRRAFGQGGRGRQYYYKFPVSAGIRTVCPGLEVDNCEISGFSLAGVDLPKGDEHHIHHNFIHHCQYNGLGYGICLDVASAVIEFNLFDWNRHSIAGSGRPGCRYVARHNVELGVSLSHCFDMHHEPGGDVAGTSIEIVNNTFRADSLPIHIGGVPESGCDIRGNWFVRRKEAGEFVIGSSKINVSNNVYGEQPTSSR